MQIRRWSAATSYQQRRKCRRCWKWERVDRERSGQLRNAAAYWRIIRRKGEQLDKAESIREKGRSLADSARSRKELLTSQWKQQTTLQKGIALSALGQVNLQKKDNASAVQNFQAAAPLLKSNDASYARNQYRLGYAF